MTSTGLRNGLGILLLLASAVAGAVDPSRPAAGASRPATVALPRPAGLKPDVEFWRRVFTEVSNDEGLVHDDTRLDVVYEVVHLPGNGTAKDRRERSAAAVRRYVTLLEGLARGKRVGLSADERRILALWGDHADSRNLAAASKRVRLQVGQSDRFRAGLVRSGLWEPYISRTLGEAGLPPELIALPHVESGYDARARSHVGAAGLWQFMPQTATDFMRVDAVVDERMDPYRATEGAARLLRINYGITGSWPTAITAYNHGAGGMRRAIEQLGTDDIEQIVRKYRGRAFGFASRNFYVSFLAAVDVRTNAERYFGKFEREAPEANVMVRLPGHASVASLEKALQVDGATLARYNPSLRDPIWKGSRNVPSGHRLYLPQRPGLDPAALLAAMPPERWSDTQVSDRFHVVRAGESLSGIAPRYGVRMNELAAANGLHDPDSVRVGQKLVLPARATAVAAAPAIAAAAVPAAKVPDEAVRVVAERGAPAPVLAAPLPGAASPGASVPAVQMVASTAPAAPDFAIVYAVAPDGTVRVQEGESLALFADWSGNSIDALRKHNHMNANTAIRIGGKLGLPFDKVDRVTFESRRIAFHRGIRDSYLARHAVEGTHEHLVRPGESAWFLAERRYRIPVWLLREYNPGVDLAAVRPGATMVIPRVAR
jgi:membrane-bound lytic murein transglycosylase D